MVTCLPREETHSAGQLLSIKVAHLPYRLTLGLQEATGVYKKRGYLPGILLSEKQGSNLLCILPRKSPYKVDIALGFRVSEGSFPSDLVRH